MIARQALGPVLAGAGVGIVGAIALGSGLKSLLFGN